jgi:hypothetical protein
MPEGAFSVYGHRLVVLTDVLPFEGRLSKAPDERCLTYCTQNISGRIEKRPPLCRTICVRRVFAHEVRNVLGFNRHRNARADGVARYPLPLEGQFREEVPDENISISGRREAQKRKVDGADLQYWEEGWYIWSTRSKWKTLEHIDLMMFDIPTQAQWMEIQNAKRKEWEERQKATAAGKEQSTAAPAQSAPFPDETCVLFSISMYEAVTKPIFFVQSAAADLFRLESPHLPLERTIGNYLAPTNRLMELLRGSFEDGTQRKFAKRVWETAWTKEPYRLVKTVCSKMWETWNAGPPDENDPDS